MTAPRIDWPALLGDIAYLLGDPDPENPAQRVPVSQSALAEYLGTDRPTVRRWNEGARVEYHAGQELLFAWERLTGKDRSFAPRTSATLSAAGR